MEVHDPSTYTTQSQTTLNNSVIYKERILVTSTSYLTRVTRAILPPYSVLTTKTMVFKQSSHVFHPLLCTADF